MPRKTAATHPCIFATSFVREQVDPRIKVHWESKGIKIKWGDLRTLWRTQHCGVINPYDSRSCPYPPEQCALAFLQAAIHAADNASSNPYGLFGWLAKRSGLDRAENKPLARDRLEPAPGLGLRPGPAPSVGAQPDEPALSPVGGEEPESVPRRLDRPQRLGDLLRSMDPRSREGRADDGEEGPRR